MQLLCVLLLALLPALGSADETTAGETPGSADLQYEDTAEVVFDGEVLFNVKGTRLLPADKRAERISERLLQAAADRSFKPAEITVVQEGDTARLIANKQTLMVVSKIDVEPGSELRSAEIIAQDMQAKIQEYRDARSPRALLKGAFRALFATLIAGLLLYGLYRLRAWILGVMQARLTQTPQELKLQSLQLIGSGQLRSAAGHLLRVLWSVCVLLVVYLYLTRLLSFFPWTRPLSGQLLGMFVYPLKSMALAFFGFVPNLIFLLILALTMRIILKGLTLVTQGVEQGSIRFSNFDPEWAQPTYKVVRILVIAFAIVVAFPYIPGSGSEAFKGVSLFLGVMVSLGSSSLIGNIIAGYTMIYRRAFKIGDRIQVGEHTGIVIERRLMVTRLRTVKNEEVVLPNAEVMTSAIVNYSAHARGTGLILHTTVGIGYETPWRQVHAMLLEAAARTEGLDKTLPAFVLQTSLGDFCVTYEINAYTRDAVPLALLYSALHENILDLFNEHGVQIMTPAYEGDPAQPKIVPPGQWYTEPAKPPATP